VLEDAQRLAVVRPAVADRRLQPVDGFQVVREHFGASVEHDVERGEIAGEIAGEALDLCVGTRLWIARTVLAKIAAPPSARSSRSTAVSTRYFQPNSATAAATRLGSSQSTSPLGEPVFTLQKWQPRVQVSPRIMMVAVPAPQHSPRFGHIASWHTV